MDSDEDADANGSAVYDAWNIHLSNSLSYKGALVK